MCWGDLVMECIFGGSIRTSCVSILERWQVSAVGEAGSLQRPRGRRHPLPPELGSFCGRMRADGQLFGRLMGGLVVLSNSR